MKPDRSIQKQTTRTVNLSKVLKNFGTAKASLLIHGNKLIKLIPNPWSLVRGLCGVSFGILDVELSEKSTPELGVHALNSHFSLFNTKIKHDRRG